MERLTQERGDRTWRLYHFGWYINLACVVAALIGALFFMRQVLSGASEAQDNVVSDITIMMGCFVVSVVLLMGAGLSRYQARLEGQHLEIKLAINKLGETIDSLKKHD